MAVVDYPAGAFDTPTTAAENSMAEATTAAVLGTVNFELVGLPAGPISGTANLHEKTGAYHTFSIETGVLRHKRAEYAIPPYELTHLFLGGPSDSEPDAAQLPEGRILLLFVRDGDAVETYSDDAGTTWQAELAVAIAGGSHPQIAVSRDGLVIRAAFVSGDIVATRQQPGDEDPSAPFTFLDDSAAPLAVEDDAFGLSFANDAPGRLLLHVRLDGDTDPSDLYSTDEAASWKLIP